MRKYRKRKNINLIILVVLFLLLITIGYAVYTENLEISGTIHGDINFEVYFMDAWIEDSSKGTVEINTNKDTLTYEANLKYPGDRVLIGVKVKNDSSIAVKLNNFAPTNVSNDSEIKFDYINLDETNEILDAGAVCEYEFVAYWEENSQNTKIEQVSFDIQLDYEQYMPTNDYESLHSHEPIRNLKINYIDENGNQLADSYSLPHLNGYRYSVKTAKINGYIAEENVIEGELNSDTEIDVVYYKTSGNLRYTNIDQNICAVSGIGSYTGTELVIPEEYNGRKVVRINEAAFRNNTKIESVVIPSTIQTLNQYSFSGCTKLKSVTILAENVTDLEKENFLGCTSLTEFIVNNGNASYKAVDGILFSKDLTKLIRYPQGKQGTEYTVPSTVTILETRAIDQNQYLEKIIIPDTVENVGDYAVALLPKLKSLTINAKNIDGLSAFCENYYLTELIIGTNLESMEKGKDVFRKASSKLSSSITMQYLGTRVEWNSIKKASSWRQNSKISAVQCTDGIINF